MGFWIEMTTADTLEISGAVPVDASVPICTGWNLVGYPLDRAFPVGGALSSIAGDYSRVFAHNATAPNEPWDAFDVTVPEWVNDLQLMQPGKGYWVLATADTTLTYRQPGPPPIVAFDVLTDGTEIFAPMAITGTITSTVKVAWTMQYRSEGESEWIDLASGDTSGGNQAVGQFDPTLLLNDIYEVRLIGTDIYGQPAEDLRDVLVSGEMKIGPFTISIVDLAVPVAGIPIEVVRTYDSRDKRTQDFGVGWSLDINRGTYKNNRKPGDGWFVPSTNGPCTGQPQFTKHHVTEIRFSDYEFFRFRPVFIVESPSLGGCFGVVEFQQRQLAGGQLGATLDIVGPIDVFWDAGSERLVDIDTGELYEPQQVRLTTPEGIEIDLTLDDGVIFLRDRNANTITIDHDGISHSSGKSISFTRDSMGRISRIVDPMGSTIDYTYDGRGDLVQVVDLDDNTTSFTYNADHDLLDIFDATGTRIARNDYDADGRLASIVDGNGQSVIFTHDLANQIEIIKDRRGNPTIYEYDDVGNVIRVTDALSNTTSYTYDERNNLVEVTDPLGRTMTSTYDNRGNLLTQDDFEGNLVTLTYNASNQATSYSDDTGRTITRTYDDQGNLLEETDGEGAVNSYKYDSLGNRITWTDPLTQTRLYGYDAFGNRITETDPLGNMTTYGFDTGGRTISESRIRTLVDGSTESLLTQFDYGGQMYLLKQTDRLGKELVIKNNAVGKPLAITDESGNTSHFDYDATGNLLLVEDRLGHTRSNSYDEEGNLISYTSRDEHRTEWTYDALGRNTGTTYADGESVSIAYDAIGRVVSSTSELGYVTSYAYAPHTEIITDALGGITVREHDGDGQLVKLTDANNRVTSFSYDKGAQPPDAGGRLITTKFDDGSTIELSYDENGNKVERRDQASLTTQFGYDAPGRLVDVTDPLGNGPSYVYDEVGNLIALIDANEHITRFEYDALGRLTKRILPLGQEESFAYDPVGNLTAHTDFNGRTTTFEYDALGRMTRRTLFDGTEAVFAYSPDGLLREAGGDSYTYDERGRLLTETKNNGTVLTYTYDAVGNRTSLTTLQGTVRYTYDALGRMEIVEDSEGGITQYQYDAVGNITTMTMANGTVTTYNYDNLNRLIQQEVHNTDDQVLASYLYTRSVTGHVTGVLEAHTGRHVDYVYDALYRLKEETVTEPGLPPSTTSYTYDAVGNRLTKGTPHGTTTYVYDANDRLISESGPDGETTFSYDDNGNLIRKLSPGINILYAYDGLNRLIAVDDGTNTIQYTYDADGVRLQRIVNGTDITNLLIDKNRNLPLVIQETDALGQVKTTYTYGIYLVSMFQPSVGSRYFHHDVQLSTRQLSDSTGDVSDTYTYDAFGNMTAYSGITKNDFLFAGEQFDPHVSAYYLRARYYNQSTGRFTTRDPMKGIVKSIPSTTNKYVYAGADPVNYRDPTGLFSISASLSAVAVFDVSNVIFDRPSNVPRGKNNLPIEGGPLGAVDYIIAQFHEAEAFRKAHEALDYSVNFPENIYQYYGNGVDSIGSITHGWIRIEAAIGKGFEYRVGGAPKCPISNRGIGVGYAFIGAYGSTHRFSNTIFLCPAWFLWSDDDLASIDLTRPITIIHEASHLVLGAGHFIDMSCSGILHLAAQEGADLSQNAYAWHCYAYYGVGSVVEIYE